MAWNKGMKKTALSGFFHCQVQLVKSPWGNQVNTPDLLLIK